MSSSFDEFVAAAEQSLGFQAVPERESPRGEGGSFPRDVP